MLTMSRKSGLLIANTNGVPNQRRFRNCDQEACLVSQKILSIFNDRAFTGQAASEFLGHRLGATGLGVGRYGIPPTSQGGSPSPSL
jgi:hypothetical protein